MIGILRSFGLFAVSVAVALALLYTLPMENLGIMSWVIWFGALFVVMLVFSVGISFTVMLLSRRALALLQRADYAGALRMLGVLRWVVALSQDKLNIASITGLHGVTLLLADRIAEAEPLIREARDVKLLAFKAGSPQHQRQQTVTFLNHLNLGYLYTLQGYYDQAIWSFDAALEVDPRQCIAYSNKAAALLQQGGPPEQALLLLDKAAEVAETHAAAQNEPGLEFVQARRGWALALLGQADAARAVLDEALRMADATRIPWYTEIYHIVGRTQRVLGDEHAARAAFQRAAALDPHGLRGRLAREQLAQQEVYEPA